MSRGVFPYVMIYCTRISRKLKAGTMNKYGIKTHSCVEQCLHMSVVEPSSVESFIIFCQAYVHIGSTLTLDS